MAKTACEAVPITVSFMAVFLYEVEPATAEAFEAAYGSVGAWACFFDRGDGSSGTDLWRAPGTDVHRSSAGD